MCLTDHTLLDITSKGLNGRCLVDTSRAKDMILTFLAAICPCYAYIPDFRSAVIIATLQFAPTWEASLSFSNVSHVREYNQRRTL